MGKVPPKCRFTFFKETGKFTFIASSLGLLDMSVQELHEKNTPFATEKKKNVYLNIVQTP